ncbi:MAG TPA: biotin/lipoyl-binding protein [Urbifossiella sp.]|jgi:multidrug resistance efflux pump|nr:biotin/lipoyl-binding protein [Urbifossiella sp.]
MTWLRKVRPLVVAAGGVVLVGSLLGARLLGPGGGGGTDSTGKAPPAPGKDTLGTVVIGMADSDPSPVEYGLAPVLQAGQVVEVFVKQGEEVKAGDKLYRFNSRLQEAKLTEAERAVDIAKTKADTARGAAALHAKKVELQRQVVAAAESQTKLALSAWELGEYLLKESLKAEAVPQEKWEERRKNNEKLFQLHAEHEAKKIKTTIEKATLADLEAAKANQVDKLIAEADAGVKQVQAMVEDARTAVEMCTVKAEQDGTVARVLVSKGGTMGVSSRAPALILIPAGPLIVRAEVEAEFAYKIKADQVGNTVTIQDFNDPKVTYQGTVRGPLGNTFLPRRGTEGSLVQSDARSLEVVIEVTNPNPPGKPPLRVNQKVRVVFPLSRP